MKLKIGMAVKVEDVISVIANIDTISTIPDIYYIKYKGWYNDWQFMPLPNHIINNPGAGIMKARIDVKIIGHAYAFIIENNTNGVMNMVSHWYASKAGVLKALRRWAKKYGVNVEIVI